MRFLRMLTNSLLAGAFGAAYLTILVLQLNPSVPLLSATAWWWFVTLGTLYGVHFAVAFYLAIVAREFVTMHILSPGWISVRLLAWLGTVLSAGAAALMWLNVEGLATALDETAEWRMTAGAVATTLSAVVLLAIAVAHYSFGRRGSRVGASLFMIAVIGSMTLPLAARGRGRPLVAPAVDWRGPELSHPTEDSPGRVTMLMFDGASLEQILPRVADGRLPNFSRVLDGGATMDLATTRPTQPDPVWAAVATGMYPSSNGVRSAAMYYAHRDARGIDLLPDHSLSHALVYLGFVRDVPLAASEWRARPLWSILEVAGLSSGIVRWPLTHPAQRTKGFVVSDRLHQVSGSVAGLPPAAYPESALATIERVGSDLNDGGGPPTTFAPGTPEAAALHRDVMYSHVAEALREEFQPGFFAVRYGGLDTVGHYYWQATPAHAARDANDDHHRRFVEILDRYYAYMDAEVGAAIAQMRPGDLLVIISGFGMQPVSPLKQALAWVLRDPPFTGTHERAPDGFLLAYGTAVQPGRAQRGSIVDVAPTLLYFFGLPVARDMEGYARADLFTRDFSADRPITFIPSYR